MIPVKKTTQTMSKNPKASILQILDDLLAQQFFEKRLLQILDDLLAQLLQTLDDLLAQQFFEKRLLHHQACTHQNFANLIPSNLIAPLV